MMVDTGPERRWWRTDLGIDRHEAVRNAAHHVDEVTLDRQQSVLNAMGLYGPSGADRSAVIDVRQPSSMSHNIIASAVDTLVSEVSQTKPRPMVVPTGGGYETNHKAKQLTSHLDVSLESHGIRELAPIVMRDAIVGGLGILRPYEIQGETRLERIFPINFLIDDRTCVDELPRCCYLRRAIDRQHLQELYPDKRELIGMAERPRDHWWVGTDRDEDMVEVWEAWHLATVIRRNGESEVIAKGRHVISTSNATLVDEEYEGDEFPFAFVRGIPPQRGFWGESMVLRVAAQQLELNKLLRRVQDSQHLMSVPRIFVRNGSAVTAGKLVNNVGVVVHYTGNQVPQAMTFPAMSGEVYSHIDWLKRGIFEVFGVSQLSAQSLKPAGLDSGRAIRAYNDVQSRRFINLEREFERLHVKIARELIRLEKRIDERDGGREVQWKDRGTVRRIKWSEVSVGEADMLVQVMASSALPNEPAGRLQAAQELVEAGIIDLEAMLHLADVPDLDSVKSKKLAPLYLIEQRLERLLVTGETDGNQPEPYMDLGRALQVAVVTLQRAEHEGAPPERLELVRQWITAVQDLQKKAQPPPPPMPMGPAMPPGPPMPPPGDMPPPDMPPGPMGPPMN